MAGPSPNTAYARSRMPTRRSNVLVSKSGCTSIRPPPGSTTASPAATTSSGATLLNNPLAAKVLSGASGVPSGFIGSLIGGITGSNEAPDPKLIQLLSVKGFLTNIPQLFKLLADLQGVMAHGDYYTPRAEFGGRSGPQVACDVMASFRR